MQTSYGVLSVETVIIIWSLATVVETIAVCLLMRDIPKGIYEALHQACIRTALGLRKLSPQKHVELR